MEIYCDNRSETGNYGKILESINRFALFGQNYHRAWHYDG